MLFCRSELGLDRDTSLWGIDAAEVILQQWACYERKSDKMVNWGGNLTVLDRVTRILDGMAINGANTQNIFND